MIFLPWGERSKNPRATRVASGMACTTGASAAAAARIPQRLTLTIPALNAAARVIFLISGAEKAKVVKATLTDGAILPGSMIRPSDGVLTWIAGYSQREAVELLKLKEMSLAEASAASGQSVGALKVSLHRAIRALQRAMGGKVDE